MNGLSKYALQTAVTVSILLFGASVAMAERPQFANKQAESIVEFALAASGGEPNALDEDGDDFDVLVAALLATGVSAAFDGTDYTVFAPNDQAFYDITQTTNDTDAFSAAVALLGLDGITAVLTYHVTEGVRNSRSVTRAKKVTMLDGNSISYDDGMIIPSGAEAEAAIILSADNRLSDGMVHVIDAVLIP